MQMLMNIAAISLCIITPVLSVIIGVKLAQRAKEADENKLRANQSN